MKKTLSGIALTLTILATAGAQLRITEVMSSSVHPAGTNNADWFELTNVGVGSLDITGWTWDDDTATAQVGNFGSITSIAAGQSIVFTGETVGAEASWISNWGLTGVTVVNLGGTVFQSFSSGGDQIHIYNASGTSGEVTNVTFGAATTGFSFAWDTFGTFLGPSAVGVLGAFQSVSDGAAGAGIDVGSPGFVAAVPEPSTTALIGIAIAAVLLAVFRRRSRAEA